MDLLRDNLNQKYCFFDFETENLNLLNNNRPWQLSYIIYQNGRHLKSVNEFIRWDDINVSKDAARITGFDYENYIKIAKNSNNVLDDFEIELKNPEYIYVYHNGSNFDTYILKNWRKALDRKNDYSYLDKTFDTNSLAKAIKKGVKQIKPEERKMMMFRFANYVEKGLKTNLTALGKEYNIQVDYEKLHDAMKDCYLTLQIFEKMKWQIAI